MTGLPECQGVQGVQGLGRARTAVHHMQAPGDGGWPREASGCRAHRGTAPPPRPTALWHGLLALPEMPASAMPVCPADHPGHKPSVPMNWGDHSQNTELSAQAEKKLPKNIAKRTGTTGHSRNRPLSLSHGHKPQEQSATGNQPRTTCRSSCAALGQLGFGSPTRERGITGLATQGTEARRDIPAFPTGPHSCQSCAAPPPPREPAVVRGRPRVPSPRPSRSPRGRRVDLQPPVGNGIKATW